MSENDNKSAMRDREIFSKFLLHTKEFNGLNWREFALELNNRPRIFKVDEEDLKSVAYRKTQPWGLLIKAVATYAHKKKTTAPEELKQDIADLLDRYQIDINFANNLSAPHFIKALGLNTNICESSTEIHRGAYLHIALDDDARMVTSRCVLSGMLGNDGTPIYRSRRRVPSSGYRRYLGAYFANDSNLYLMGTPLGSVDIRLSLFSIVAGERQDVLRGLVLGVSQRGTILTSRCLLIRSHFFKPSLRKVIFSSPLPKGNVPPAIFELTDYLFGVEKPEYIKVSTGE